ncbi:MAG TPA: acyl-CoA dehydrogenase family protein [Candidatus Binataceae bacterium]|nr:acyl-CoA dehydrogenase family protein [Candidatus Binataceae bacterium]
MTHGDEPLSWPFFEPAHRELAVRARAFAAGELARAEPAPDRASVDRRCRELVRALGRDGLTRYCVRAADGGALAEWDVRAICLVRETLAGASGLADFAFAMQGLGSGALSLAADASLRARYLPRVAAGEAIAAFALSEPDAGSDVAAMRCSARRDGDHYVLDGTKTWISNGGIADFYCVFARTVPGERRADGSTSAYGISAFVVEPDDPGFRIGARIDVIAPHPLAELRFESCRIAATRRIGAEGDGFKIAMRTLDVFRTSVAAAALGFAQRAFDGAIARARSREMFGRHLADFQLTQAALAEMATTLDSARLLTYRAAWLRDRGTSVTAAAAMAKLAATEGAQRIIDRALQMFGGQGLRSGEVIERLYREIRALRIYEGASEVQKLIIAREILNQPPGIRRSDPL